MPSHNSLHIPSSTRRHLKDEPEACISSLHKFCFGNLLRADLVQHYLGGLERGSSGGMPMTAERKLSATRMLVSRLAARGRTKTPSIPLAAPLTRPGKPASSTPLLAQAHILNLTCNNTPPYWTAVLSFQLDRKCIDAGIVHAK